MLAAFENKLSIFELCRLNYVAGALYAEAARSLHAGDQTPHRRIWPSSVTQTGRPFIRSLRIEARMKQFADDAIPVGRWLDGPYPCGLQIAEPAIVAAACDTTVVMIFWLVDHALGGSGAPLMQFLDFVSFRDIGPILTLNIGGIANCQLAPPTVAEWWPSTPDQATSCSTTQPWALFLGKAHDADGAAAARALSTGLCCRAFRALFDPQPPRNAWRLDFGSAFAEKQISENQQSVARRPACPVHGVHSGFDCAG